MKRFPILPLVAVGVVLSASACASKYDAIPRYNPNPTPVPEAPVASVATPAPAPPPPPAPKVVAEVVADPVEVKVVPKPVVVAPQTLPAVQAAAPQTTKAPTRKFPRGYDPEKDELKVPEPREIQPAAPITDGGAPIRY